MLLFDKDGNPVYPTIWVLIEGEAKYEILNAKFIKDCIELPIDKDIVSLHIHFLNKEEYNECKKLIK